MSPELTFMRTQLQSGRSRQRRKYTSVPTSGSVSWVMSRAQALVFEAWFRDVVIDGASWFYMPRKTPLGMQSQATRFTAMPDPEPFGPNRWKYSSSVETWGRPVDIVPAGWGEFPQFLLEANIIDVALNREWPEA